MSLKKSATRWGSAAPPLTASRSRPPSAVWAWRKIIAPRLRPDSRSNRRLRSRSWSNAAWKNGPRASTSSTMRRWTASHSAGTPISAVGRTSASVRDEARGVDAERINDRRAARERQQHPAGEFEGVMEREQREHHVIDDEREDPREHRHFGGEIPVRQHHALGRAGGARGEDDRRERLALGRRAGASGRPVQDERTRSARRTRVR